MAWFFIKHRYNFALSLHMYVSHMIS